MQKLSILLDLYDVHNKEQLMDIDKDLDNDVIDMEYWFKLDIQSIH